MSYFLGMDPFYDFWPEEMDPSRLWNQGFGLALPPVLSDLPVLYEVDEGREGREGRRRNRRWNARSEVTSDKEKFEVTLDLPEYKTNEISVKVVDNALVIDAEHEERPDEQGHVTRRFRRRYFLPRSVDPEEIHSSLSDEGVLKVTAKKNPERLKAMERTVEIKQISSSEQQPSVQGQQGQQQQQQQLRGQQQLGGQREGEVKLPYAHGAGDLKIPVQHERTGVPQHQQQQQQQAKARRAGDVRSQ